MKPTTKKSTAKLNAAIAPAIRNFKPPEDLTVAEWADRHRRLSPENSAESGPWRTSRTPYLREPMEAFTDPRIRKIVMVAASQVIPARSCSSSPPSTTPESSRASVSLQ